MSTYLPRAEVESLDGLWSFVLRPRPEAVTESDIAGPAGDWSRVEVPGCWTMQGFDRPQYTNTSMPFAGPPPHVPEDNPTGVYRRRVKIPPAWRDRRVVLHVGGAESVLYVHVDGRPIGMGKDSRLPSEFDLSGVVVPGQEFELALTVVRWSDATYLEDQDHWYHAGLHRSVFVYATPDTYVADIHAAADYDAPSRAGRLTLRVVLGTGASGPQGWKVRAEVAGFAAEAPARFEHPSNEFVNMLLFTGRGADFSFALPDVQPWSAEEPHLYEVAVRLIDADGNEVDAIGVRVGFRRVEVIGHEFLVNGRPVLIKGVNRHDHDMRRGKAVTRESILGDVVLMKQHNINAVRTSHYPNDPYLYEVCDRLGMYVVDEANVETHAYLRSLTRDPTWAGAILERIMRMALRDKNHPSVVMWSLGNESGVAPIHLAAAEWLRAFDGTRPISYEGGISEDQLALEVAGSHPELAEIFGRPRPESDVIAPMYPPVDALVAWATRAVPDRPLIMCEYCHAMGNSCGGLADYWEAIKRYPGLQGGFVWDWVDQSLVQALPDGRERLAYGGDFGDEPNDGAFCMNGLVASDRTPHPSLLELAKIIQPIRVAAVDAARGVLEITNEHDFVDLSWLEMKWEAHVNGSLAAEGTIRSVALGPGESSRVTVPLPPVNLPPGGRAHLTLWFRAKHTLAWAPAGHVVAWEQIETSAAPGLSRAPRSGGSGQGPTSLAGLEPELALWRAPIDNEVFGPCHAERWDRLGLRDATAVALLETSETEAKGALIVSHAVTVGDGYGDIPRVGVRLRLGSGIHSVEWLGIGPHECYSDRQASGRFGLWATPVDEWLVPYVHPQASGNRLGVRWLRFLDAAGAPVLTIDELDDACVTVSRYTEGEVAEASHLDDLLPRDDCYVWIDARQRGVGSGACGPDTAPGHRLTSGPYRWGYRLYGSSVTA
jgi:beta-galactosidase